MSEADLGYVGMVPLGWCYVCQQAILTQQDPAGLRPAYTNAANPTIPADAYLLDTLKAVLATSDPLGFGNWKTIDEAVQANASDLQGFWTAFQGQGTIPTDREVTDSSAWVGEWDDADNITKERWIFCYRRYDTSEQSLQFGLNQASALYMQVQGYSNSTATWVLPRRSGEQVWWWRFDGFDGSGNRNWKTTWESQHWNGWQSIAPAITWIAAAVVTVCSFGTLAAPAIGAAIGLTAAEVAADLAIAAMIAGFAKGAAAILGAVQTGNSAGVLSAFADVGSQAIKAMQTNGDLTALANKYPGAISFATTVATDVSLVYQQVQSTGKTLSNYIEGAQALVGKFSFITDPTIGRENYWTEAMGAVGVVGAVFVQFAKDAPDVSTLQNWAAATPWYAEEFLNYGAIIRAAELAPAPPHATLSAKQAAQMKASVQSYAPVRYKLNTKLPPITYNLKATVKASAAPAPIAVVAAGAGLLWWLFFL